MKKENKRKHKRSAIELAASYGTGNEADLNNEAIIKNISQEGLSFHSKEDIKINKEFILAIEAADGESIEIAVKAVWSVPNFDTDDFIVGVKIVEKSQSKLKKFNNFLQSEINL